MSFVTVLNSKCREYTNMVIEGIRIQLPYRMGGKNVPSAIKSSLIASGKSGTALQEWATANSTKTGVDCSGLVYYTINEASGGAVRSYFENALSIGNLSYAYGISAANLTSEKYGKKITKAKDMVPGCLMRSDGGGHVLVITGVSGTRIDYTHSNGSKGSHTGYITIGDPNSDLAAAQTWYDSAYTDSKTKGLYNYTILLNCLAGAESVCCEPPGNAYELPFRWEVRDFKQRSQTPRKKLCVGAQSVPVPYIRSRCGSECGHL